MFNTISDYNETVSSGNHLAHTLINASKIDDKRLIVNGFDTRPGLESLAVGLTDGTAEIPYGNGFTGHHMSLRRISRPLSHVDPNWGIYKVGELKSFGFSRSGLVHIGEINGKPAYSGYETRGRSVFCTGSRLPNGTIQWRPEVLWDRRFEDASQLFYDASDHCREEDWAFKVNQMRGIWVLFELQQKTGDLDTRAYYNRNLAQKFIKDTDFAIRAFSLRAELAHLGA